MAKQMYSIGDIGDARLRLLRIFKAVVECNGFVTAEVELNISSSAISIAISELETYLGFTLCQRGRSGFALTEEGARVYDSILQLFGAMDSFKTQISDLHEQLRGELNIGITDNMVTIPHMHLTNALKQLKEENPQVKINIRMMSSTDVELQVLDNRLHIGVVPESKLISGLDYLPLYDEESKLYCGLEHPLFENAQAASDKAILQQDAVLPTYAQTAEIKSLYERFKHEASATDREGVVFLLLSGRFIGFLPVHYARQWVDRGELRELAPERMRYTTEYCAIRRSGARPNLVRDTYWQLLSGILD